MNDLNIVRKILLQYIEVIFSEYGLYLSGEKYNSLKNNNEC